MATFGIGQLHEYASLFSSQICERAIRFGDVDEIKAVYCKYDKDITSSKEFSTWDYLAKIYRILTLQYRNEYIYKNELLNHLLLEKIGHTDTIIFNEFAVGRSIADIVFVNGNSKAFEIKSELDSDKRLLNQLSDYKQLFEECYIVIPEEQLCKYKSIIDPQTGIIVLFHTNKGSIGLEVFRVAEKNEIVNADILMQSVRTEEYKRMVKQYFGELPKVSSFEMYEVCRRQLSSLTSDELHELFKAAVKHRKNSIDKLPSYSKETRQMWLSLNLSTQNAAKLNNLYKQNLNL